MDFGSVAYDLEASKTAAARRRRCSRWPGKPGDHRLQAGVRHEPVEDDGAVDIVGLDLSTMAAPTTLVTQADPNLF